jgi:hypothetical protein
MILISCFELFKHGFNFLNANFTFLFMIEKMEIFGKRRKEMLKVNLWCGIV